MLRLLSVGWPEDRLSLFVGVDCKALWGQRLVAVAQKWHGAQSHDLALRKAAASGQFFSTSENNTYGKCDFSKPFTSNVTQYGATMPQSQLCFSACCAMSHQLVMMHAFHFKHLALNLKILILEEDASFAPGAFAPSTEQVLRALQSQKDAWNMLKLGECEVFTDDERAFADASDRCATNANDPMHEIKYQQITGMTYDPSQEVYGGPDRADPRMKRSYCSHSYIISGALATHLVGTHYPIFSNCDDQMRDACETSVGKETTCKRLDKYIFNQNQSSGSSLVSSCHPCNGEETFDAAHMGKVKLEQFNEPRPSFRALLTGARPAGPRGQPNFRDTKLNAATWKPQDVNNMCGLYAHIKGDPVAERLDYLSCHEAESAEMCYVSCRHHSQCRSFVYHPRLPDKNQYTGEPTNVSAFPTSQYFLCQQDPYTDLSEKMDVRKWQGKCCLRTDDKWLPFIPPIWFYYDKTQPHVVSGTTMGDYPLSTSEEAMISARFEPGSTRGGLRVHMSDEIPDYLSAPPNDEVDLFPHSPAAIRYANAVEYRQYGTVWAVARKQCQRRGLDLCPPTSYCKNGNKTRMVAAIVNGNWWETPDTPTQWNSSDVWIPTLRACNSWINLKSCEEPDGATPEITPYLPTLKYPALQVGCCTASEEATDTTQPDEIAADHDRRAFLAKPGNRNFVLNSLDKDAVNRQQAQRGRTVVLRIVVNHATSGLFASFQWVMLALRFAKAAGLRAYVDHGPCTLCGYAPFTQDYSYHDWTAGPNAWTYFWEPVDTLSDLMASRTNQSVDVVTLDTHQIWNIFGTKPEYDIQSFQKGDFSGKGLWGPTLGVGGPVKFDARWWAKQRTRAWQLVGQPTSNKPIRMSRSFAEYEQTKWSQLLTTSAHNSTAGPSTHPPLIAAHIRGTDKQCSIGGPKIPPSAHFALIDAFLSAHPGSLVFVATDAPSIANTMRERYGDRLLMEKAVRSEKNALHEHGNHGEGYAFGKASGAMLDSAHLSRADFLLCANSALGESAVWLNPRLAENMFNLQFPLLEQVRPHHAAVFGSGNNGFDLNDHVKTYQPGLCVNKPAGP